MRFSLANEPCEAEVPKVPRDDVRLLWASGYWDGPLEGLAEVAGEQVWYCLAQEAPEEQAVGWFRRFWLVRLTAEQLARELARHQDFRTCVGTHFDYDADGQRDGEMQSQAEWRKFYDKYGEDDRAPRLLPDNEVIGWFEW